MRHHRTWQCRISALAGVAVLASGLGLAAGTRIAAAAGALTNPVWSVSSTVTSTAATTYTYTFTTATTGTLAAVEMTVPAGTAGAAPTVGTVTGVPTGGSATLTGTTLQYTFTSTSVSAGTAVSIQIGALTNSGTNGSYTSTITTCTTSACTTSVDSGTTSPAVWLSSAAATSPTWSVSSAATGATSVTYTYNFTTATSKNLNFIVMGVPPGTGGTPTVGTVSGAPTGGTVALSGNVLTYTATGSVGSGTAVSIQITGLTNTLWSGTYKPEIATHYPGFLIFPASYVDSAYVTNGIAFTGTLTSPTWSASSTTAGIPSVSYTYSFTTASSSYLTSITMTVPSGTSGTPTVGTVTPPSVAAGGSVNLAGTTLTYTFTATTILSATAVSIQITGLNNTPTPGSYTSTITTLNNGATSDSGTTPSVGFTGALLLSSPGSLTWTTTLNGTNQSVVDGTAADQQFIVVDTTGTGAGWHIVASATTLTSGANTLPDTGTLVYTGSTTSASATTAPSSTCIGSCTLPTDTTSYPVAITTAASSPASVTLYDAAAATGKNTITIGGSTSTHPGGWWVAIPANAFAGSYTSTVTISIISGP